MWSRARRFALGCLLVSCLTNRGDAQTSTLRVATGVSRPVFAVAPPGDANRLFIAEQHTGRIEIMDLNTSTISTTPFLDLGGLSTGNEQGLLGLAFDPDYANNGYFYVNVTTSSDGGDTHIRRYTALGDPATSTVANLASEFEVLSFNQPQSNHNGGWIDFSPTDGYLYIASGDGGGSNDNGVGHTAGIGNAQDTTNNLLGKILRIDVTGDDFPADTSRNYAVPSDNPFVEVTGDDEIWAYGLRNPYRSSFDRTTGDLWIGDVGQNTREEIDYQRVDSTGGENYGWRLREGAIATPTGGVGGDPPSGNVEPIYDYGHGLGTFQGNVVIGGYVYRGPVEEFQGHYFFADSESHNIWKLDPDAVNPRLSVTQVNSDLLPDVGTIQFIGSFGEDGDGNLYIMEVFGGEIFRITTASQDSVWNGDDATAGAAGDGTTWTDADNWTRGGTPDQDMVDEDHVIFAAGSSQSTIDLGATRTVSAATFQAAYTLQNNILQVLSGNVAVEAGVTATISSTLQAESADHSLRKLGPGTLLIEGDAGQMVVKAGTLGGSGTLDHLTVRDGGTVAPGASIGTLNVDDSFTMENNATLSIEISGTESAQFDRLLAGGTAMLDGALDVQWFGGFTPDTGDRFPILVAGDLNGTFDGEVLPSGYAWGVDYNATTVSLEVLALLGDMDANDLVNAADAPLFIQALVDHSAYAAAFPLLDADLIGDMNRDGTFDLGDLAAFSALLGGSASAVPEPQSLLLTLIAAALLPYRRK